MLFIRRAVGTEHYVLVDTKPISGALVDFAPFFFRDYWEEKPMKAWLSFLASAVVCVSAFAQQPPPDVKQKVDSLIAKLRDAYVKNDAAAYARAFTSDGILVTLTGKVLRGQQEIEQGTKTFMSSLGGTKDLQVQIEELHALPDGTVWYIGHATIVGNQKEIKDHYTVVAVPEGNGYAYKMLNIGLDEPSPR